MNKDPNPSPSYIKGYRQGWLDARIGNSKSVISSTWPTWGDLPHFSTGYDDGYDDGVRGLSTRFWQLTELQNPNA